MFTDPLGHQHFGQTGDYLVESSCGMRRIAPRSFFEDIYVPLATSLPTVEFTAPTFLTESSPHSDWPLGEL
jgi:hypothetical protein